MRLIDSRYQSVCVGVGTAKSYGRVHLVLIKIGNTFFPCSFNIIDSNVEFLIGLDLMRRHQCCIDIKENALKIGNESVTFLTEKESTRITSDRFLEKPPGGSSQVETLETINFPTEEKIKQLMNLGFSREEVIKALNQCDGHSEAAASILFQGKF